MTSIRDLLNQIENAYEVLELTERGATAGGRVREYDLWYKENGVVRYKRIHIFVSPNGNAEWYGSNPIPVSTRTFADELRSVIEERMTDIENAVYYSLDQVDDERKRALVTLFLDDGTTLKTKKVFIRKNSDGTWDFRIREIG